MANNWPKEAARTEHKKIYKNGLKRIFLFLVIPLTLIPFKQVSFLVIMKGAKIATC